eukprot:SAG11_NODE_819_length_7017_cov_3.801821_5_plen_388_part_00
MARAVDRHVATWAGPIWGLPSGNLPAGPIMGNGDLGVTLQTNNNTGCIELWLGLNSMWGMPNASENPPDHFDGSGHTYNPTAPYPQQRALGGVTACVLDPAYRAASAMFSASQFFADGVVKASYQLPAGQVFSLRSVVHPTNKTLVTSLAFSGVDAAQHPAVSVQSWTRTLWLNATPAAATASTRGGWDAATGTQYVSRVAIPGNTPARKLRQLHVVVGTRLLAYTGGGALGPVPTSNHILIANDTAATVAGLPAGSVAIGAACTVPSGAASGGRLVFLTVVKSNLDLGTDFAVDPLPATQFELQQVTPKIAAIEADNDAYWRAYWGRASVSLPQQPRLEEFWYVANHMISVVSRPAPARFGGSTFPNLWGFALEYGRLPRGVRRRL